ncbi:hypothetical protein D3C75_788240 [compost metagenome]
MSSTMASRKGMTALIRLIMRLTFRHRVAITSTVISTPPNSGGRLYSWVKIEPLPASITTPTPYRKNDSTTSTSSPIRLPNNL